MKQYTRNILMVEPVDFAYNTETAVNNHFQEKTERPQEKALAEFLGMVEKLRSFGINVMTIKDRLDPHTPDSIFPNNWISFHSDGTVVQYPMFAENRRAERREDILDFIESKGYKIDLVEDYTAYEDKGIYLEGTGSIIFDRENKIAFASISDRTNEKLFLDFCEDMEYAPLVFHSYQKVGEEQESIYHTNVMMCVADRYAVICLESILDEEEKQLVKETLERFDKEIIEISLDQMHQFAGNMLQVEGENNQSYLVMSQTAFDSLLPDQIAKIESYNPIIPVSIPTIETNGGGSARCMMAEVFLPKKNA